MNIFQELKKKYKTQKNAAQAVGASQQAYSEWVLGRKIPAKRTIKKIIELSGKSKAEVLDSIYFDV